MGLNYEAGRCPILRYFSWGLGLLLTAATTGLFVGEGQKHSQPCTGREESPCRIWCYCILLSEDHSLLPGLLWELTQNPNHLLRISIWNAALLEQDYFLPKQNFLPVTALMSAGLPSLPRGQWHTFCLASVLSEQWCSCPSPPPRPLRPHQLCCISPSTCLSDARPHPKRLWLCLLSAIWPLHGH